MKRRISIRDNNLKAQVTKNGFLLKQVTWHSEKGEAGLLLWLGWDTQANPLVRLYRIDSPVQVVVGERRQPLF